MKLNLRIRVATILKRGVPRFRIDATRLNIFSNLTVTHVYIILWLESLKKSISRQLDQLILDRLNPLSLKFL